MNISSLTEHITCANTAKLQFNQKVAMKLNRKLVYSQQAQHTQIDIHIYSKHVNIYYAQSTEIKLRYLYTYWLQGESNKQIGNDWRKRHLKTFRDFFNDLHELLDFIQNLLQHDWKTNKKKQYSCSVDCMWQFLTAFYFFFLANLLILIKFWLCVKFEQKLDFKSNFAIDSQQTRLFSAMNEILMMATKIRTKRRVFKNVYYSTWNWIGQKFEQRKSNITEVGYEVTQFIGMW